MALSVPLSRFTPRVGGGSAFYVRLLANITLMRNTAKEISDCHDMFKRQDMLLSASADDIFRYFAYCAIDSHQFQCADAALKIRLSKDAEIQSKRMVYFTVGIFFLTAALVALTIVLVFKA